MKKICDLIPDCALQTICTSITRDSRKVVPGALFFAIKGDQSDGHDHIQKAIELGAVGVVVEQKEFVSEVIPTIWVPSSRKAFALASARWFAREATQGLILPSAKMSVVGVTGTNGKTTTTYLLKQLWESLNYKVGIIGTVEYLIGEHAIASDLTTPDPYMLQSLFSQMLDSSVTHSAIEVSSIALDQDRVLGTNFSAGLFTNLTQDHLDYHGDFESYYQAKLRFFTDYDLPLAIINGDSEWGQRICREISPKKLLTYGLEDKNLDYRARVLNISDGITHFAVKTPITEVEGSTTLVGKHNLYNLLGAIAIAIELGGQVEPLIDACKNIKAAPGRLERVASETGRPEIYVDYAHTPDALEKAIFCLSDRRDQKKMGRIITVFGCGGDRDRSKRPLMAKVAEGLSDIVVITSDNPRTESCDEILDDIESALTKSDSHCYYRERDRRKAIHLAINLAEASDLILVAGKGHENYQIIGDKKLPFDDRLVIEEYYKL